jgi:nucleotide-binding universal stress UspA family protein
VIFVFDNQDSLLIRLKRTVFVLFSNILVPYDGSKHSYSAFKIALDMAKRYNSKITGITCIDIIYRGGWYYDSDYYSAKIKKQRESVRKSVENLEKAAKKQGTSFDFKIFQSRSAVEKIVSFAKTKKIDLIVMGSHGRTGFDNLLLGSVANGVAQRVRCPVLIVK